MYTSEIKKEAEKLRAKGVSYSKITEQFHVPKSTLSFWFSKKYNYLFNKSAQIKHLAKARIKALASIQARIEKDKNATKEKILREIAHYPLHNLKLQKSVLASLYWAEGAKYSGFYGMKFANSDPKLAELFITLLRNTFIIDEKKFRITLYLHNYHNEQKSKKFWSELLKVPESQFYKTYWKKRGEGKKYRENFMGVCFIYHSDSNIRKEMMELCNQMHSILCHHRPKK